MLYKNNKPSPDQEALYWERQDGEWSVEADIRFEKHLKRLADPQIRIKTLKYGYRSTPESINHKLCQSKTA